MKKIICSSLVVCASLAFAGEPKIITTKAKDGMDLVLMPEPKVPLITVVLVAKAGAMTETKDINGLTHLWEHMFFKGNARIPNQEAFNKRIRQLGISFNGDTSPEMVRYYFTLPSKFLGEGIQFMADAISTPLLEQKEMERERHVVLDEYDRAASRPTFDNYNLQRILTFGDEAHQRDPLGRRSIIEKATREQLLRIKKEVFVPDNTALVVVGDFNLQQAESLINQHFANWKTPADWKPVQPKPFPPFPEKSVDFTMIRPLVQTPQLTITFEGPKARSSPKDTYTVDILSTMMRNRTNTFFKKFIDSGFTLDVSLNYHTQSQTGEISYFAATEPTKVEEVKKALLAEIPKFAEPGYFTEAQLLDARKRMRISHKHELNKPSDFAKTLAFWWAITGIPYYESYLDELDKVTLVDVSSFVKTYLVDKPYIASVILSPEAAKEGKLSDTSKDFVAKHLKNYATEFN